MSLKIFFPFTVLLLLLFSSCIGKKKYLAEISGIQKDYNAQIQQLDAQWRKAERMIDSLTLQLAEKTGANNALILTQDKLQERIDLLQEEIESKENIASSQKQASSQTLKEKDDEIKFLIDKMESTLEIIKGRELAMRDLSFEVANAMQPIDTVGAHHEVEIIDGKLNITLFESLMFRAGSTRVRTLAIQMLGEIATVLEKYPQFKIKVEGHSDNRPTRNYKSNWELSVLRANSVVGVLTKEYGLSPSQITVAGRGEFSPKASNDTSEGRAMNRRIEIIVAPRTDMVLSAVKRQLEK